MLRLHDGVSLMLLDVTLPGMLSPQVLREARRIQPDLKVVLTSAHGDQRVAGLFKDLTFDRFIRKPYRIAEVVEVIRAALSK
jgi:DNA-binding response OmpR family regulator